MRILILNWRCPKHPKAGGAEVLTYEVARRLIHRGHSIEWFSASFPNAQPEENLDGIQIVRRGRQWTVHWRAFRRYHRRTRDFDLVIDEVNTVPFFTPLWARIPILMMIHQLAREVWWYESPFPVSLLGYATEPWYLRLYRRVPVITVSPSTESDLRRLGFEATITVLPEGLEDVGLPQNNKAPVATFVYVGRVAPSKRISDIILAFSSFLPAVGSGELWIIGKGSRDHIAKLERLTARLGLAGSVRFLGWLPSEEKHRRMAEAHALLVTSVREGWGLVVIEANACGTPAIVYDVPGLRDSVRNEQTGLVVAPRPEALAQAMTRLLADAALYQRICLEAKRWSETFTYERTAAVVCQALGEVVAA